MGAWLKRTLGELMQARGSKDPAADAGDCIEFLKFCERVSSQYLDSVENQYREISDRNTEFDLFVSLTINYHHDLYSYVIDEARQKGEAARPLFYVGMLFALALDYHISIYTLMSRGLENSSRVLFRSLIEVYDVLLCISHSNTFLQSYLKTRLKEDGSEVMIPMKRGTIASKAAKALAEMDRDLDRAFSKIREAVYHDLSDFVHVSADTTAMSVMLQHVDGDPNDRLLKPGGMHTPTTKKFYLSILNYSDQATSMICNCSAKAEASGFQ